MIKYSEFLEKVGVVSEDEFNSLIESLPDCDIEDVEFDVYDYESIASTAVSIVDSIVRNKWNDAWVDDVDLEEHTIELDDVESIEDLDEIVEYFSGWTISNYDEIKRDILEYEEEEKVSKEHQQKMDMLGSVIDRISLEDVKKFINDYAK